MKVDRYRSQPHPTYSFVFLPFADPAGFGEEDMQYIQPFMPFELLDREVELETIIHGKDLVEITNDVESLGYGIMRVKAAEPVLETASGNDEGIA